MTIVGLDCAEETDGPYECSGDCFLCYVFCLLQSDWWGYCHTWVLSPQLHSYKKISTLHRSKSVPFELCPCLPYLGPLLRCASLKIKLPMLATKVIIHTP
uniref:Uncharacterized protein n=1 Tax=Opuntia streptacantha TaxID=393608 RepID=A0A7C8ZLI5_OPUST